MHKNMCILEFFFVHTRFFVVQLTRQKFCVEIGFFNNAAAIL